MPESHIKLFQNAQVKYVENNKLFVHGGINPSLPLEKNSRSMLLWDRSLLNNSKIKGHNRPGCKLTDFDNIFIGHTTTEVYDTVLPVHYCEVWNIDTGAGWSGKLTIMDIDTKEYFQSDLVTELYPGAPGREVGIIRVW